VLGVDLRERKVLICREIPVNRTEDVLRQMQKVVGSNCIALPVVGCE
jgi:hypothetical protein